MKNEKKNTVKYTIQFNPNIVTHLQAIKILDSVSGRGKAQLIANALVSFNNLTHMVDVNDVSNLEIKIPTYEKKENTKAEESVMSFDPVFELEDEEDMMTDDDSLDEMFRDSLKNLGY